MIDVDDRLLAIISKKTKLNREEITPNILKSELDGCKIISLDLMESYDTYGVYARTVQCDNLTLQYKCAVNYFDKINMDCFNLADIVVVTLASK